MPEPPLLSIPSLPPTPSHHPKPQGPFDIEGPSVCLYCSPYWTGERKAGTVEGAGCVGQEEELGLVKNIFIINKQGCKRAGEAVEILMNKRGLGILARSPSSDGFNLCLRKDILGSGWSSGSLSPGLMLGALPQ